MARLTVVEVEAKVQEKGYNLVVGVARKGVDKYQVMDGDLMVISANTLKALEEKLQGIAPKQEVKEEDVIILDESNYYKGYETQVYDDGTVEVYSRDGKEFYGVFGSFKDAQTAIDELILGIAISTYMQCDVPCQFEDGDTEVSEYLDYAELSANTSLRGAVSTEDVGYWDKWNSLYEYHKRQLIGRVEASKHVVIYPEVKQQQPSAGLFFIVAIALVSLCVDGLVAVVRLAIVAIRGSNDIQNAIYTAIQGRKRVAALAHAVKR